MIIAKLSISYDRGLKRNNQDDLGIEKLEKHPESGKVICGLGMHYVNADIRTVVKQRDKIASEVRESFNSTFLRSPLDGVYMMPERGAAQTHLDSILIRPDMEVRVTEFELTSDSGLDSREMEEWSKRVKKQLSAISLGRKKDADEQGLRALTTLADCPLVAKRTATKIKELVELLKTDKITRVELKRGIETMDVEIEAGDMLSPRRAPIAA